MSQASTELYLVATTRGRGLGRLAEPWPAEHPDASLAELSRQAATATAGEEIWLRGGEPCLRADLPRLIAAAAEAARRPIGLRSDALALASGAAIVPLRDAGLGALRVLLHSSNPDAHDWLVGQSGAARRAMKIMRRWSTDGLALEVEATVTRPTAAQLPELLRLCQRLGVRRLLLRRFSGGAADDAIALSPRLALTEPIFDALVAELTGPTKLTLEGFPRCALGAAAPYFRSPGAVRWTLPPVVPAALAGCPVCPGEPDCAGAPSDYVAHFGRAELDSEDGAELAREVPGGDPGIAPPPPRQGRAPATRHRTVNAQVGRPLAGDPLLPRLPGQRPVFVDFEIGAGASTREIRKRLVRAAQEGAPELRVRARSLPPGPDAAALLAECTRLAFEQVELTVALAELERFDDPALYALRGLTRALLILDTAAEGERAGVQLARAQRLTGAATGLIARVSDAQAALEFARAFEDGSLPGPPRYEPAGDRRSLAELARSIEQLPAASAAALAARLPACARPSPREGEAVCDSLPARRCPERRPDCPGFPGGWSNPE